MKKDTFILKVKSLYLDYKILLIQKDNPSLISKDFPPEAWDMSEIDNQIHKIESELELMYIEHPKLVDKAFMQLTNSCYQDIINKDKLKSIK